MSVGPSAATIAALQNMASTGQATPQGQAAAISAAAAGIVPPSGVFNGLGVGGKQPCPAAGGKATTSWACYVATFKNNIKSEYPELVKEQGGFFQAAKLYAEKHKNFKFMSASEKAAQRAANFAKLKARGKVPRTEAQKEAAKIRRAVKRAKVLNCARSGERHPSMPKGILAAVEKMLAKGTCAAKKSKAKHCSTGKKCGKSCQSKKKSCHKKGKSKGKSAAAEHKRRSEAAKKAARTRKRNAKKGTGKRKISRCFTERKKKRPTMNVATFMRALSKMRR